MHDNLEYVIDKMEGLLYFIDEWKHYYKLMLRSAYDLAKYLGDENIEHFAKELEIRCRALEQRYDRIYKFVEKLLDAFEIVR